MKGKTTETVLTFYEGIVNKHGQGPGFSLCRKGVDALPAALHAPALIKRVIAGGVCEQEEIADPPVPHVIPRGIKQLLPQADAPVSGIDRKEGNLSLVLGLGVLEELLVDLFHAGKEPSDHTPLFGQEQRRHGEEHLQSEAERASLLPAVFDHDNPHRDFIHQRDLGKGLIGEAAVQIGPRQLLRRLGGGKLVILPRLPDDPDQSRAV